MLILLGLAPRLLTTFGRLYTLEILWGRCYFRFALVNFIQLIGLVFGEFLNLIIIFLGWEVRKAKKNPYFFEVSLEKFQGFFWGHSWDVKFK